MSSRDAGSHHSGWAQALIGLFKTQSDILNPSSTRSLVALRGPSKDVRNKELLKEQRNSPGRTFIKFYYKLQDAPSRKNSCSVRSSRRAFKVKDAVAELSGCVLQRYKGRPLPGSVLSASLTPRTQAEWFRARVRWCGHIIRKPVGKSLPGGHCGHGLSPREDASWII